MKNVNVRSGPATTFKPPLGKVNEFETYDYLGTEDGWYKFNYRGQVAYIAERFARYKEKGRRVPAPEPRRIYVRRETFFEKGVGVGPYPEFPLWGAYLAGLVVVLLIVIGAIRGAVRRRRTTVERDCRCRLVRTAFARRTRMSLSPVHVDRAQCVLTSFECV